MNTFETFENRCRICALELSDLTSSIPIFSESSRKFFLQNKISKYLYFTVSEDDFLPKNICPTCFLKIESIDKFAFSAAKNQECFLSWLKNKSKHDVNQTTIEMSTNSDFSFSNIIIKKESNQKQQIVIQPHKSTAHRNPRHSNHITLEQIINDQIIKNPKLPASTTITKIDEPKRQRKQNAQKNDNISIVSYHNLQIGQLIKDYELLKLILRALKWEEYDRKATYHELIERLRRSNCRDILTNKNLLNDNDVVQLLRSYVNDSMLMNFKVSSPVSPHQSISKIFQSQPVVLVAPPAQIKPAVVKNVPVNEINERSETMEVSLDPEMYLDEESIVIEDDEETVSATEAKLETEKLLKEEKELENVQPTAKKSVSFADEQRESNKIQIDNIQNDAKYICTSCPETFTSNTELQNHVTTHLISSTSSTKISESAIKKPLKKKKLKEDRLKSKRKKIFIRINPSPRKNRVERARAPTAKFFCAICKKTLSSKRNVEMHQETHKESNGKFRCDGEGCKKLFGKLENFLKHRAMHEKPVRKRKSVNEK